MEKEILKNQLFNKYFKVENGILATQLVDKLSFIPELYKRLHIRCENNIRYFDSLSILNKFELVDYKQNTYLILKLRMLNYVIIDVEKMENITEEQFRKKFNESFFINNFDEIKNNKELFRLYNLSNYNGNIYELVNFYNENKDVFCYQLDYIID